MERKIGEIFEYNGEWYQCIKENDCIKCAFIEYCRTYSKEERDNAIGFCVAFDRSDGIHVIFKKLEKVGEPYEYFIQGRGIIMMQEYALANLSYICDDDKHVFGVDYQNGRVAIEIKQNKENMEEKKQKMDKLVTDYSANKITYKEFEESIIELYAGKHTEVNKPNLKEFSLEAAKAGKPVCTRDGRNARIICFDLKGADYPIVVAVKPHNRDIESVMACDKEGKYSHGEDSQNDLMMLPEKKERWVNIYEDSIHDTKDEALNYISKFRGYIKTIKIELEE